METRAAHHLSTVIWLWYCDQVPIEQFHESQNLPALYPTMLHSEQKYAHSCSEWSIMGYGTGAFWDLGSGSIVRFF